MQKGTTLLELLVVLAVFTIVFTGVVPSANELYQRHRITAQVNLMSSYAYLARSQAIEQHRSAVLCPTSDFQKCDVKNWHLAKMLFFDNNQNNKRDDDEPIEYAGERAPASIKIKGPNKLIRFYEDGIVASTASLIVCTSYNDERFSRAIFISLQGRVRLSQDLNGDGKHQKGNGSSLLC